MDFSRELNSDPIFRVPVRVVIAGAIVIRGVTVNWRLAAGHLLVTICGTTTDRQRNDQKCHFCHLLHATYLLRRTQRTSMRRCSPLVRGKARVRHMQFVELSLNSVCDCFPAALDHLFPVHISLFEHDYRVIEAD